MRDKPLADFLTELGAKQPTPGGGAVAALNGAIAAAQLKMVCEYTESKNIKDNAQTLAERVQDFLQLADADSAIFSEVSEAYKTKDESEINRTLTEALNPSKEIVTVCEELISFCEINHDDFNPRLKADLIVCLANLKAAIRSSLAMIITNLEALGNDTKEIKENREYCYDLLDRINKLYQKLGA